MGLVSELRRRNVFRVAIAYLIIGWLILQVGDTLAPALRLEEWVNTALAFFLILGFPIALTFAWAFELTPEGLKKEKHVDRADSITHITGRKLDYLIIAVLVLALGLFAFDRFVFEPSRHVELVETTTKAVMEQATETGTDEIVDNSIAVLPFADLSPERDQEYFSDGISEEILNVLAHVPGLQVTSRSSSFSFKGKSVNIPTVARQLGVANILEGSVRKSGKRIRITAQLVDARTDRHLWSETYDRDLEDIFALQDEISAAIVMALKEHLGLPVEAVPRVIAAANTEAHEAYLRGRYLVVQRTRPTVEGAVGEFEKAIVLDPDYALAHAELVVANLLLARDQLGDLTLSDAIARAAPHADQAMALDPTLAEVQFAKGSILEFQWSAEDALKHFRQAIQINPNYSIVYLWMGGLLNSDLGLYDEGFAAFEAALRLDPLSIPAIVNYVLALIERNRLNEAEEELEKLSALHPDFYAKYRGALRSLGGKWANAVLDNLNALRINPQSNVRNDLPRYFAIIGLEKEALAISESPPPVALRMLGKPEDAVTTAQEHVTEDPIDPFTRHDLGLALASAGDYARARPILEEMWQRTDGRVTSCCLFEIDSAAALISIRRDAGEEAEIGELVAAIRDNVRSYREAGVTRTQLLRPYSANYEEGLADYLTGERDRGLALIAKSVEDGYFISQKEAYLQAVYDDPGFAPIRAEQEARQAHERDRFLAIVCTDNPYAAVWQPAAGTCEQFAAADGN